MKSLLQLVNDLERESGTIAKGARLATVVNSGARQEKFIEWIHEAYRMVQVARQDWPWMRKEFEAQLVIGQARYTAAELGVTDLGRWVERRAKFDPPFSCYDPDPTRGRAFEQRLMYQGYGEWRARYDFGVHDRNHPIMYSFDAPRRLCVGPTPDKIYQVRGDYYRKPHVMVINTDVPIIPEGHEMIIVWQAIMLLGDHDESATAVATGKAKRDQAMRNLVNASLPEMHL